MSTFADVMAAVKEVMLLTDKVERAGMLLSEISKELQSHDRRIVRLETIVEIAGNQPKIPSKL